ncbi:DUF4279 domain-containing protein [Robertmurraya sp. FSL R5-0851]|uniref:DUF4279 domain-containing protein n=1 Tax=Robertmurraya sp. FSL R5-0851 TaxID=2921584 RepID=UPI0030F8C6FC
MGTTNLYCTLTFRSDTEKFNLSEFENKVRLYKKRSWKIGDLQHPEYEESARVDSSAVIKSDTSHNSDGTEVISEFFKYLILKKEEIMNLTQQYKASLYFDIVINLESDDSPVVSLNQEHLCYLTEIGASLNYSVYDYK